jgi:phage tail tape-measure protein
MSRKTLILFGMVIGSLAGGYVVTLFGAHSISFASVIGSAVGGLAGIWVAFRMS